MGKNYTITAERYLELLEAEEALRCLQSGGVDNWEGYDASMEEYVSPELPKGENYVK